jgi:hypothetical protein
MAACLAENQRDKLLPGPRSMMGVTETPPGWYPDPPESMTMRYWNGTDWTAYTSDAIAHSPSDGRSPKTVIGLVAVGLTFGLLGYLLPFFPWISDGVGPGHTLVLLGTGMCALACIAAGRAMWSEASTTERLSARTAIPATVSATSLLLLLGILAVWPVTFS